MALPLDPVLNAEGDSCEHIVHIFKALRLTFQEEKRIVQNKQSVRVESLSCDLFSRHTSEPL